MIARTTAPPPLSSPPQASNLTDAPPSPSGKYHSTPSFFCAETWKHLRTQRNGSDRHQYTKASYFGCLFINGWCATGGRGRRYPFEMYIQPQPFKNSSRFFRSPVTCHGTPCFTFHIPHFMSQSPVSLSLSVTFLCSDRTFFVFFVGSLWVTVMSASVKEFEK